MCKFSWGYDIILVSTLDENKEGEKKRKKKESTHKLTKMLSDTNLVRPLQGIQWKVIFAGTIVIPVGSTCVTEGDHKYISVLPVQLTSPKTKWK